MDNETCSWILEFILRQPIANHIANSIFLALPFNPSSSPIAPHLKKTILLRRIAADPLSEQTLLSFELIHELHRLRDQERHHSPLLAAAYCEAAVASTLRFLRDGELSEFLAAVDRIWRRRVGDIERFDVKGLVSGRLVEWKKRMEAAAESAEIRDEVMAWKAEEGMERVIEYLREEFKAMGPTSLEIAASAVIERRRRGQSDLGDLMGEFPPNLRGKDAEKVSDVGVRDEEGSVSLSVDPVERGSNQNLREEPSLNLTEKDGANLSDVAVRGGEGSVGLFDGPAEPGSNQNVREEPSLNLTEKDKTNLSVSGLLPTPEVGKVKQALKTSCEDLRNVVEDPLPDARNAAARVIATRLERMRHLKEPDANHSMEPEGNRNKVDVTASTNSADKGDKVTPMDGTRVNIELKKDPDKISRQSLMDRNPTAQTYEWEDEPIQSESENAASPLKKLHLSSPRRKVVSPLIKLEHKRAGRRRNYKRWTTLEEDTLREAVKTHGRGNWKTMLSSYSEIFKERTEGDLKDKWRNMVGR